MKYLQRHCDIHLWVGGKICLTLSLKIREKRHLKHSKHSYHLLEIPFLSKSVSHNFILATNIVLANSLVLPPIFLFSLTTPVTMVLSKTLLLNQNRLDALKKHSN